MCSASVEEESTSLVDLTLRREALHVLRQPVPQDLKGGISAGSLMTALVSLFVHEGFGIEEVSIHEAGEEQSDQGLGLLLLFYSIRKLPKINLCSRPVLFDPALEL